MGERKKYFDVIVRPPGHSSLSPSSRVIERKKVFSKAPRRFLLLKEVCPGRRRDEKKRALSLFFLFLWEVHGPTVLYSRQIDERRRRRERRFRRWLEGWSALRPKCQTEKKRKRKAWEKWETTFRVSRQERTFCDILKPRQKKTSSPASWVSIFATT